MSVRTIWDERIVYALRWIDRAVSSPQRSFFADYFRRAPILGVVIGEKAATFESFAEQTNVTSNRSSLAFGRKSRGETRDRPMSTAPRKSKQSYDWPRRQSVHLQWDSRSHDGRNPYLSKTCGKCDAGDILWEENVDDAFFTKTRCLQSSKIQKT